MPESFLALCTHVLWCCILPGVPASEHLFILPGHFSYRIISVGNRKPSFFSQQTEIQMVTDKLKLFIGWLVLIGGLDGFL